MIKTERTKQALGYKTIEIDNEQYKIKAKVGQIPEFLTTLQKLAETKTTADILEYQIGFVHKLLVQGNNNIDEEDLRLLVELNLKEAIFNTKIALKLAKKEDLEAEVKALETEKN